MISGDLYIKQWTFPISLLFCKTIYLYRKLFLWNIMVILNSLNIFLVCRLRYSVRQNPGLLKPLQVS